MEGGRRWSGKYGDEKCARYRFIPASASAGVSQNLLDNGYDKFPASAVNKKSPFQLNGSDYNATTQDFTRDNYNYTHTSSVLLTALPIWQ